MTRFDPLVRYFCSCWLLGLAMLLAACVPALADAPGSSSDVPEQEQAADARQPKDSKTKHAADSPQLSPEQAEAFYRKEVLPILKKSCYKCHGQGEKPKGNLHLTTRTAILRGGDTGPAADLEQPEKSLLLSAINYQGYEMPPSGKLPAEQVAVLEKWVKLGLPGIPSGADKPDADSEKTQLAQESKNHWAFQPLRRPELPDAADADWVKTPLDAFILKKLQRAGLRPAAPAGKTGLLRRAYYDLIGLPPSPQQVRDFLADDSPQAYERVIDRLLESPQYGEHWARHWLDLVRYAETNSYERDGAKPEVWRYRDYVIDSFNADKPYDRFIIEQLAGDEIQSPTRESIIATGYYRLGIWDDEPVDREQALYDDLDDILSTTGQVFLGLTVNCARCHDHKLDPIPQRDYYRMLSFFAGVRRYGVRSHQSVADHSLRDIGTTEQRKAQAAAIAEHEKQVEENAAQLAAIEQIVKKDFEPVEHEEFKHERNQLALVEKRAGKLLSKEQFARYEQLFRERERLRKFKPPALDRALAVKEIGPQPRPMHLLVRGNPHVHGEEVEPGFLSVLSPPEPEIQPQEKTSGRRLALARWIAHPDNPLTARVMANRLWQYHFGRGLVRSPNNFGLQGTAPTHPELLDWLASELVAGGWRLKRMHKLLMLSAVYQMASTSDPAALVLDPENDLIWRFDMRRLSAEELRDSLLAVTGRLNLKQGGPSIYPTIPQAVLAGQSRPGAGWGNSSPEEKARRSIYIHIKRSLLVPLLESFDAADTDSSCPVRFATTQPTQALGMLNSELLNQRAAEFADDLRRQCGDDPAAQVRTALWRVWQREPSREEVQRGVRLMDALQEKNGASKEQALQYFCLMALNLNEFIYLD